MKASLFVGLFIFCLSLVHMIRAEARHAVEFYNKHHQESQVAPILTSETSSARLKIPINTGVRYLGEPLEHNPKKFIPRNAKLKSAMFFAPKMTKFDVKSLPLHQDYDSSVYKLPVQYVQAQSLPLYKEDKVTNYPNPSYQYKPQSLLPVAPVIYPSAIIHQVDSVHHPHHQYAVKDHLEPTLTPFYNHQYSQPPVAIPDEFFRTFFEMPEKQYGLGDAFSFRHNHPSQYFMQRLQQYPFASGSSPNPVVQSKDELAGAYSNHIDQTYGIQKYPITVKKEIVGEHNFEGKPWGTKTTYTYKDPKDSRNFLQVSEVKMNLDQPVNAEVAKAQLDHLLQRQTTLLESVKSPTPITRPLMPDTFDDKTNK